MEHDEWRKNDNPTLHNVKPTLHFAVTILLRSLSPALPPRRIRLCGGTFPSGTAPAAIDASSAGIGPVAGRSLFLARRRRHRPFPGRRTLAAKLPVPPLLSQPSQATGKRYREKAPHDQPTARRPHPSRSIPRLHPGHPTRRPPDRTHPGTRPLGRAERAQRRPAVRESQNQRGTPDLGTGPRHDPPRTPSPCSPRWPVALQDRLLPGAARRWRGQPGIDNRGDHGFSGRDRETWGSDGSSRGGLRHQSRRENPPRRPPGCGQGRDRDGDAAGKGHRRRTPG